MTNANTIGELAVAMPEAIPVLEKLGIDYCCHGEQPVQAACSAAGITADELLQLIGAAEKAPAGTAWETAPVGALIAYIIDTHHAYTRQAMFTLQSLAAKVSGVHGGNHPELLVVQRLVAELATELIPHMLKEEQVLFPYINAIDEASIRKTEPPIPFFGTARNPIRNMMLEHDSVAEILRELRVVTANYDLPDSACASYSALFSQLMSLETDLHQHIHLENNILCPRAIDVEEATRTTPVPAVFMNHVCHGTKC